MTKQNNSILDTIYNEIINDPMNKDFTKRNIKPLYFVSENSKILIIGQAPGKKAQDLGVAWKDISGDILRDWLGVTKDQFYDDNNFGIIPMDFYYPGKGKSGDLPPRPIFSMKYHSEILESLKNVKLIILIGAYAQNYYLKDKSHKTITENIENYKTYLPKYFPIVHPSPRNRIWLSKNPWFIKDVLPELKMIVKQILNI